MSEFDEALVEEVREVLFPYAGGDTDAARAVLAHLAATGRLIGDGEWQPGRWWRSVDPGGGLWGESSDEAEIRRMARPGDRIERSWHMERDEWRQA